MATIAVVDDEPALLQVCVRLLQERGHVVRPYKDGRDALDAIEASLAARGEGLPDLVVSDVQMPRLDGISLCRAVRAKLDRARLPFVLVSVLDAEDDILRAFEAGANDYLTKPYRTGALLAKVSLLLKERDLLRPEEPWTHDEPTNKMPLSTTPSRPRQEDKTPVAQTLVEMPPAPPFTFDRYDVRTVIGRGGMSVVYRAIDLDSERPVALKLLSPHVAHDRHGLARFLREVAALQRVESPHVVRALDSGMDRGLYFLTMELVEGLSAKQVLMEDGPFAPKKAAAVGRDVALALQALADMGLLHRDVKPSNFIIKPDGRAVLVDFGLARQQELNDLTESGEAVGTPQYLAPEVIQGGRADPRADLYALGVSIFELISGKKPYVGRTAFEVFHLAVAGAIPDLTIDRPETPPGLAAVVRGLLERDPDRRLAPADAVAAALAPFAG